MPLHINLINEIFLNLIIFCPTPLLVQVRQIKPTMSTVYKFYRGTSYAKQCKKSSASFVCSGYATVTP
jgi:hypothetical protein